jgi:hypothetical protein
VFDIIERGADTRYYAAYFLDLPESILVKIFPDRIEFISVGALIRGIIKNINPSA